MSMRSCGWRMKGVRIMNNEDKVQGIAGWGIIGLVVGAFIAACNGNLVWLTMVSCGGRVFDLEVLA